MTLLTIDCRFEAELPDDGPAYPLFYIHELEAGLVCTKTGALVFTDHSQGFAHATLFARLIQDDADADIELRNIFWGAEKDAQELEGAIANAAEAYIRLNWGDIESAFSDFAETDWCRIMVKGGRSLLKIGRAA